MRAAYADDGAITVDRQVYVATAPADPYNKDQLSLHVAAAGGQEIARSYLHLAYDSLPERAVPTDATLKLIVDTSSTNNQSATKAIVSACVVTQPIPDPIDSSHLPTHDCSKGSAVGVPPPDATSKAWTFNLKKLVDYWNANSNNGLVLIGVIAPGDTWSVGWDKTQTGARATYTIKPAPEPARQPQPAAEPAPVPAAPIDSELGAAALTPSAPINPSIPVPATDAGNATAAPAAPNSSATQPSGVRTIPGHRSGRWIWVLLGALVAAAILAAQPVVAIATAGAGHIRNALTTQLQQHARAMATSVVVVVWTITYGIYSIVVTPPAQVITGGGFASSAAAPNTQGTSTDATINAGAPGQVAQNNASQSVRSRTAPGQSGIRQSAGNTLPPIDPNTLPPAARLYSVADDRIGMTDKDIYLCGHAALLLGPAFHIQASDLNVFWDNLNDHGGINGRKVHVAWNDDSYQPANAVAAAQSCKDASTGTFMLLGGIGFDQIPAVRVWAEQNKMMYLHHVAVQRGSEGLRYSFTGLPSVEQMGHVFGELAVQKYAGHKVGIMWRNSSNWQPGRDEFLKVVNACKCGIQVKDDFPVSNNQGVYTQQLATMAADGVDVVFAWENATAASVMVQQAKRQQFNPHWLLFPFNLTLQAITTQDALNPPLEGVAAWPAYAYQQHGGAYSSYASDLIEFERQYAQYDQGAELNGPGGDLLFLAWVGFKGLADLLQDCGRDCSRNKMAATMLGYHKTVTPNCDADFTITDHHHAAPRMDILAVTTGPAGASQWTPVQRCVATLKQ